MNRKSQTTINHQTTSTIAGIALTLVMLTVAIVVSPVQSLAAGLSGSWNGHYYYNNPNQKPVGFLINIRQQGNRISGEGVEPNTFADPSVAELFFYISGEVNGSQVHFTKTLDGTGGASHSIFYIGTLDSSGRSIRGEWRIPTKQGVVSGRFDMMKE